MAQVQVDSLTVSIPVADFRDPLTGAFPTLEVHDTRLNNTLTTYRLRGYDLISVVYVPAHPVAPHFQMFFIKQ